MTAPNTLFLRLEGPLQAWGDASKFVVRRTAEAPTKSGVLGMICCAMGKKRCDARPLLVSLNSLAMGVRIDRPGTLWSDYHTVGAGIGILRADGQGIKRTAKTGEIETLVTRRYYLCDARFLVALQGDPDLVREVRDAFKNPRWPIFLGRKSCPPTVPVLTDDDAQDLGTFSDLLAALKSKPWQPRFEYDETPPNLDCLCEWQSSPTQPDAPPDAEAWDDAPVSFDPPFHQPRLVLRTTLRVPDDVKDGEPVQQSTPLPPRPRADYGNEEYKKCRTRRLEDDHHLCVFCKAEARTVQHVTYRRAGGYEKLEDLRSLCRLCHDAVTMIEYGLGMGLDRINPENPRWRQQIIRKRDEIIRFRSLETRQRHLQRVAPEEVE